MEGVTETIEREVKKVNPEKFEIKAILKKSKKSKGKGIFKGKFLKKPKVKIEGIDAKKLLVSGAGHYSLVKEGRTGYFNDEYEKETKWLS